jgi:hypothetical protein
MLIQTLLDMKAAEEPIRDPSMVFLLAWEWVKLLSLLPFRWIRMLKFLEIEDGMTKI